MAMDYSLKLEFKNKDDLQRAFRFIAPLLKEREVIPCCNADEMTISYGLMGHIGEVWHKEKVAELAKAFPAMPFRMTSWDDQANYWWAYNKNGTMTFVDHHEEIYEMMWRWHIDVEDPFAGPSKENWAELKRCREQYVQEMIDLGVDIAPGTWPPTDEQLDQEYRLRYDDSEPSEDDDLPF